MKKLVMILVMAMVAFGSFAKSFEYKSGDDEWTYEDKGRYLYINYKRPQGGKCSISYFDVSEEDAWIIINGEEFHTFEVYRLEYDNNGEHTVSIFRMPCRDYRNRK